MTGGINDSAYSGIEGKRVYSSYEKGTPDSKIDYEEAISNADFDKDYYKSAFEQIPENMITDAKGEVEVDSSLIKKYLGTSFDNLVKNTFQAINYNAVDIKDSEHEWSVQWDIDMKILDEVKNQLTSIKSNLQEKYGEALQKAVQQAKREQFGLSGDEKPSEYEYSENGIATFEGASGAEEKDQTEGYKKTVAYLTGKGAKTFQREVNGKIQTIYVFKGDDNKKQRVVVDDAGQMHNLETTTVSGKNTYITSDAKQAALDAAGEDASKVKIKRRKVDGEYQNVVRYKDEDGKKQARVIDQNEVSGHVNVSDELEQVDHGGKAKYTTSYSTLSTASHGSYKSGKTQSKRDEGSRLGVGPAVNNLIDDINKNYSDYPNVDVKIVDSDNKNVDDVMSGNTVLVTINGQTYSLSCEGDDHKDVDKQIRLIRAELAKIEKPTQAESTTVDTSDIEEDTRVSANTVEQDEASTRGNKGIKWGVDSTTHQSNDTANVHSLKGHYNENLSRTQFIQEGWRTDKNRTKEKDILEKMDSPEVKGYDKSVRNIRSAGDFADRYLRACGLSTDEYDYHKLGDAIATANPSLFDEDGYMYKDADFSRLNLPSPDKLARYKMHEE